MWLAGIAFGLSGCATKALWESQAFDGFNEPSRPPSLHVFRAGDDWLVQYDEVNENTDRIKHRAYYLKPNGSAIRDHKRPHFVCASDARDLSALRAVISNDGQQFTLYEGEERLGPYDLPVYPVRSGRVKQVLLTPCTLVADATVVGGYLAAYWVSIDTPPRPGLWPWRTQ